MRTSFVGVLVVMLGLVACDDDELLFPPGSTGSVTGDAGRGGQDSGGAGGTTSTSSTGGTGGVPSTGGPGGSGGATSTSSTGGTSTSSTGGAGGAGGAPSTGGAGGSGGAEPIPCTTDADCAALQPPPFARCWLPAENGNNTCIQCVPGDYACPAGQNLTEPWVCPLIYDNPGPCGLFIPEADVYKYCCQDVVP